MERIFHDPRCMSLDDMGICNCESYTVTVSDGSNNKFDPVQKPKGYNSHPSGIEAIVILEHMGYNIGSAMKYLWRHKEKDNPIQDLKKAIKYIEFEIAKLEREKK